MEACIRVCMACLNTCDRKDLGSPLHNRYANAQVSRTMHTQARPPLITSRRVHHIGRRLFLREKFPLQPSYLRYFIGSEGNPK